MSPFLCSPCKAYSQHRIPPLRLFGLLSVLSLTLSPSSVSGQGRDSSRVEPVLVFKVEDMMNKPIAQVKACSFFDSTRCVFSDAEGKVKWTGGRTLPLSGSSPLRPTTSARNHSFIFRRSGSAVEVLAQGGKRGRLEAVDLSGKRIFQAEAEGIGGSFRLPLPAFSPAAVLFYRLEVDGESWLTSRLPTRFSSAGERKGTHPTRTATAARMNRVAESSPGYPLDDNWYAFRLSKPGYRPRTAGVEYFEDSESAFTLYQTKDSLLEVDFRTLAATYKIDAVQSRIIATSRQEYCEDSALLINTRIDTLSFDLRRNQLYTAQDIDCVGWRLLRQDSGIGIVGTWKTGLPAAVPYSFPGTGRICSEKDSLNALVYIAADGLSEAQGRVKITRDSIYSTVALPICPMELFGETGIFFSASTASNIYDSTIQISKVSCTEVEYRRRKDGAKAVIRYELNQGNLDLAFTSGSNTCRSEDIFGNFHVSKTAKDPCSGNIFKEMESCVARTGYFPASAPLFKNKGSALQISRGLGKAAASIVKDEGARKGSHPFLR